MADIESPKEAGTRKKRMQMFRFADRKPLDGETMNMVGFDASAMAGLAKMKAAGAAHGVGEEAATLFSEGPDGMSLTYAWFKSGFVLPKHSHNSDCLYFVMGGELRMGTQVLRKGDGIFIPEDDGYTYEVGPEGVEVLEFRNVGKFNFVMKPMEDAYWDKMADAIADNKDAWETETRPTDA